MKVAGLASLISAGIAAAAGAQSPRYPLNLSGSAFIEQVRSDVTTASGSAERRRTIDRSARYAFSMRQDTIVVTADSLRLDETADNVRRTVDVDAVIGGRWKLLVPAGSTPVAVDAPFVPGVVVDVSDLGAAMDDFLPAVPPPLAPGKDTSDGGRTWRRLADSAARQRYHWSERRHADSTSIGADSVTMHTLLDSHEESEMAWDPERGPLAWTRRIETTVTSRFAGRTVRAVVEQRVRVTRAR